MLTNVVLAADCPWRAVQNSLTSLAQDQTTGIQDPRDDSGVVVRRPVHHGRAVGASHAGHRDVVLDGKRFAFEQIMGGRGGLDGDLELVLALELVSLALLGGALFARLGRPAAAFGVFWDFDISSRVFAQIRAVHQVLAVAQLGDGVLQRAHEHAVFLVVAILELQAGLGREAGDVRGGDFGWRHGIGCQVEDVSIV